MCLTTCIILLSALNLSLFRGFNRAMDLLLKDLHLIGPLDSLDEHAKSLRRHFPDPAMQIIDSIKHATQDEITCFRISETWRKHATPCFRYVYVKVVRFRCIRSNGNARKRHETGNGNTGYPSCFRNGLTCFCHVSVYGSLQFRPVLLTSLSRSKD